MSHGRAETGDPFLLSYSATDLRIASEFLANWLPFLSRGLCQNCTQTLSDRIRSLETGFSSDDPESANDGEKLLIPRFKNSDLNGSEENHENCDINSLGSWKDGADMCETTETSSVGNFKDGINVSNGLVWSPSTTENPSVRLSWADMAQEDEFEGEEESVGNGQLVNGDDKSGEVKRTLEVQPRQELSREQREYIRFRKVGRKKDFICLERIKGKIVNILDGLELHTGIFSAAEQKRIVDLVYLLEENGKNGELKGRTYTAPQKWMRGKGRVTIQFGCCYNYATDKNGNPPGIIQKETVDPIPDLFKVIIRRLVRWHVLPPSCVPDSCIVNIYEEGDCIPPHIDSHDFVRPFCTVSFLSECNIVFGSNLKIVGAGEFSGSIKIPLPVGSVLVLNGNAADVAKHCVPAVPTKRISITFRKMDESKWPIDFAPEPDLQGLQPLSYEEERPIRSNPSKSRRPVNRRVSRREENSNRDDAWGFAERGSINSEPPYSMRIQLGSGNRRRVKINLDS